MNKAIDTANEAFASLKSEHTFVAFEKHGGALRNSYDAAIPEAMPDVVFGDILPWSQKQPEGVYVTEKYNPHRGEAARSDKERALKEGADLINRLGKRAVVYSWFRTPELQYLADHLDIEPLLIARDEILCGIIEDKALLRGHLDQAGCQDARMPKHFTLPSADKLLDYKDNTVVFSERFVVQGRSMGGDGTVVVANEADNEKAKQTLKGLVRVSEFVDAPYSSLYCVSVPSADKEGVSVYVDGPSHKPVDIPLLGIGNTAGAGGDWRLPHDSYDAALLTKNITKLAEFFYKTYGYFGHFVVEGFIKDGEFLYNEINARPCGGSEVNSSFQLDQELPPFTVQHILGRMGLLSSDKLPDSEQYNQYAIDRAVNGQPGGVYYLKYKNNESATVRPTANYRGSGIYKRDENGQLSWDREGLSSAAANASVGEILITNGPDSVPEASVASGKQVCSVEGYLDDWRPLFDSADNLHPHLSPVVHALKGLFIAQK